MCKIFSFQSLWIVRTPSTKCYRFVSPQTEMKKMLRTNLHTLIKFPSILVISNLKVPLKLLFVLLFMLLLHQSYSQDGGVRVDTLNEIITNGVDEDYSPSDSIENKNFKFDAAIRDTVKLAAFINITDSINKFKKESDFQYPPFFPKKEKEDANNSNWLQAFFSALSAKFANILIWLLIISVFVVIIILYAKENNIKFLFKNKKAIDSVTPEINFNDIHSINYAAEIAKALQAQQYNLAARLQFLEILALMARRNMINYGLQKTNFDYQMQLINSNLFQPFSLSAAHYDYAWYSGNIINQNQYQHIVKTYTNLKNLIA